MVSLIINPLMFNPTKFSTESLALEPSDKHRPAWLDLLAGLTWSDRRFKNQDCWYSLVLKTKTTMGISKILVSKGKKLFQTGKG